MPSCAGTYPSALVPSKYIWYIELCKYALVLRVQEARVSTFRLGKWILPIRNSIVQHQEATEVTVKILSQLMLSAEPCQVHEYCPQLLQNMGLELSCWGTFSVWLPGLEKAQGMGYRDFYTGGTL